MYAVDVSTYWTAAVDLHAAVADLRAAEAPMRAAVNTEFPGMGIDALRREQEQALSEIVATLAGAIAQLTSLGFTLAE